MTNFLDSGYYISTPKKRVVQQGLRESYLRLARMSLEGSKRDMPRYLQFRHLRLAGEWRRMAMNIKRKTNELS